MITYYKNPHGFNKQQTPGADFTNILRAAFTRADPKSVKKLLYLTVFLALLGSLHVKAAHKMLVKLTPVKTNKFDRPELFVITSFS